MRLLTDIPNTDPPSSDYPKGRIRNKNISNVPPVVGTPIVEELYGDIVQFFQRLMTIGQLTANGLAENVTNGYQLIDALYRVILWHFSATNEEIDAGTTESKFVTPAGLQRKANSVLNSAAGDATSKANAAESNAASDATTKANAAYNNAVSTAASDATSKANAAYTNAVAKTKSGLAIGAGGGEFTTITHNLNIPVGNQSIQLTLNMGSSIVWQGTADLLSGKPMLAICNKTVNSFDIMIDLANVTFDVDWVIHDNRT